MPFAVTGLYREWEDENKKKLFSFTQLAISADDHLPGEESARWSSSLVLTTTIGLEAKTQNGRGHTYSLTRESFSPHNPWKSCTHNSSNPLFCLSFDMRISENLILGMFTPLLLFIQISRFPVGSNSFPQLPAPSISRKNPGGLNPSVDFDAFAQVQNTTVCHK